MAGLFDIFSNTNAQDAANAQSAGLLAGQTAATGPITAGYGAGANALTTGAANATNALTAGAGNASNALQTNYSSALQPFLQNYQTAQGGTTALGNALGLNGAGGNAAATSAFWNNPAIKSQIDIGSENVLRNASRTGGAGGVASGGTAVDLQNLGQSVASKGWSDYVNSLQPFLGASQNAASGIGNLYSGLGQGQANIAGNLGRGQADIASGLGSGLAGQSIAQGNTLGGLGYQTQTGIGNAQANADLANNAASANMWGAIMNGAKLAMGAAGGMGGGGGGSGSPMGWSPSAGAGAYGNGNSYPSFA